MVFCLINVSVCIKKTRKKFKSLFKACGQIFFGDVLPRSVLALKAHVVFRKVVRKTDKRPCYYLGVLVFPFRAIGIELSAFIESRYIIGMSAYLPFCCRAIAKPCAHYIRWYGKVFMFALYGFTLNERIFAPAMLRSALICDMVFFHLGNRTDFHRVFVRPCVSVVHRPQMILVALHFRAISELHYSVSNALRVYINDLYELSARCDDFVTDYEVAVVFPSVTGKHGFIIGDKLAVRRRRHDGYLVVIARKDRPCYQRLREECRVSEVFIDGYEAYLRKTHRFFHIAG